ncbi:Dipeptidyl peptidase 3 [Araneus ventricosus]|uniref:Dipeptidyl peptidase 3 n=1 Tax=Araneus ventricosus TaxID=182803 RepID=A0A4Y2U7N6_ARAVE|nr:Dipeptidyl peptidase 3 [Araneus ventricosus]
MCKYTNVCIPKADSWLQAHSQARYVMLQVTLESCEDFVKIEKVTVSDDKPDLLLTLDRSKLASVGKKAIGDFLGKLQPYRSAANIAAAKEMYDKYSLVASEENKCPFLEYRKIVMDRKKPRRMFVQANTFLESDKGKLKTYPSTPEGMSQSWMERF